MAPLSFPPPVPDALQNGGRLEPPQLRQPLRHLVVVALLVLLMVQSDLGRPVLLEVRAQDFPVLHGVHQVQFFALRDGQQNWRLERHPLGSPGRRVIVKRETLVVRVGSASELLVVDELLAVVVGEQQRVDRVRLLLLGVVLVVRRHLLESEDLGTADDAAQW